MVLLRSRNCSGSSVPRVNRGLSWYSLYNALLHYPVQCEHSMSLSVASPVTSIKERPRALSPRNVVPSVKRYVGLWACICSYTNLSHLVMRSYASYTRKKSVNYGQREDRKSNALSIEKFHSGNKCLITIG